MATPIEQSAAAQLRASAYTRAMANGELLVGGALIVTLAAAALFADPLALHESGRVDLHARFVPPGTAGFPLGADHLGRDLWSRALDGLDWSLGCALTATLIAAVLGTLLGVAAAESGGLLRRLITQTTNLTLALPGLVVAICVVGVVGQGFWPLVLTLGFLTWPVVARVVLAETSSLLTRDYVLAARLSGAGTVRIMSGHVLPALRPSLLVIAAFHFADMLIAESALSFLGIGAPVGAATWGNMLADSRPYLFTAPWMLLVPAAAIVLAVVAVNLVGDGLAARFRRLVRGGRA